MNIVVKTRLRNRLGDETLNMLMKIGIEEEQLDMIIRIYYRRKKS